jgi:hypothetical protein
VLSFASQPAQSFCDATVPLRMITSSDCAYRHNARAGNAGVSITLNT